MTDGFGLTQVGTATGSATNFVVTVTTPEVDGEHRIRILLPADYADRPDKRYPVLYFLHGASDDPGNPNVAYPALTAAQSMITVIPDGGRRGWCTNWLDQGTAAGAQNWENFHISQVIPFIDTNLRTVSARRARAVAGLSMGGFGALHYAQRHPGLFSQVASLSGANELSLRHAVMRAAVVATLTNIGAPLCGSSNPTCSLDFGPAVSSDAVFGTPYPVFGADWRWDGGGSGGAHGRPGPGRYRRHAVHRERAGQPPPNRSSGSGRRPSTPRSVWTNSDTLPITWTTGTAPGGATTATAATPAAAGRRTSSTSCRVSKRRSRPPDRSSPHPPTDRVGT